MKQPTLFDLEAFTKNLDTPVYDPFWDELDTRQNIPCVGAQNSESDNACKSVGAQVATDTKKVAPQHDTHWIEKYWVERSGNKYWYFRYCWMVGRKKNRLYLGSVNSISAKRKKADVEVWMKKGKLPVEIKQLIQDWKYESPTMPKMPLVSIPNV
ncbi:Arm DNA-binding domain-containing protein [Nostoc sp. CHAB 5784]|uniref:Arm DNA-binding domain-containing protein n=1 Tax=Nostoc mirabile TaxID=2907820 RepID=UPI001E33EC6E|nr:Arm DNA-binding domain-containing protein [Nostoc mirabile]MCC5669877.1 Arm DNA-binding domain-containing protein [Nostoc mirabile CHAB5784]